jgi:hypothetical protein
MKRKMFFLVLLLSIITESGNLHGQSQSQNNFMKYWYYRFRFKNNFVVIGDCQGCSMPAPERHYGGRNSGLMYWGDGMENVGDYMIMLVTEYKQLKDNNQPVDKVLEEIYYVLLNIERNDLTADSLYTGRYNSNGFFLRDIVPPHFVDQNIGSPSVPNPIYSSLNKHVNDGLIWSYNTQPIGSCHSDFSRSVDLNDPNPNGDVPPATGIETVAEMSQDHAIRILGGLGAIKKYVTSSNTYLFRGIYSGYTLPLPSVPMTLKDKAQDITGRIISYISSHWYSAADQTQWWTIRNPRIVHLPDGDVCYPVHLGGEAQAYAKALVSTAHQITGTEYNDGYTNNAGQALWTVTQNTYYGDNNEPLTEMCMASSPTSLYVINPVNPLTMLGIRAYWYDYRWIALYAKFMWGYPLSGVYNSVESDVLDKAPCEGPYNYVNDNNPNEMHTDPPFQGPSYIDAPANKDGHGKPVAEYPGLDYMVYYGLYASSYPSYSPGFFDMIDRSITYDFPKASVPLPIGSDLDPYTVLSFSTIKATNHIQSGGTDATIGHVTYRAGEEVALLPGFVVEDGAVFNAYIQPIDICAHNYRSDESEDDDFNNQIALTEEQNMDPEDNDGGVTYDFGNDTLIYSDSIVSRRYYQYSSPRISTQLNLFPNPVVNHKDVTVTYSAPADAVLHYSLFDFTGKEITRADVKVVKGADAFKIETTHLASGVYILSVETIYETKKIKLVVE